MSISILNRGASGGLTASIFVEGLSESDTVTVNNGSKTKQGVWNSEKSRHEITKIKDLGTWTVTATNGEKTITQDVLVDVISEYKVKMAFEFLTYFPAKESDWVENGGTFLFGDGLYQPRGGEKGTIPGVDGGEYVEKILTIPIPKTVTPGKSFVVEFEATVSHEAVEDMGGFFVRLLDEADKEMLAVRRSDDWSGSDYGYQSLHFLSAGTLVWSLKEQRNGVTEKYKIAYDGTTATFYVNDAVKHTLTANINFGHTIQIVFVAISASWTPSVYVKVPYLKVTGEDV